MKVVEESLRPGEGMLQGVEVVTHRLVGFLSRTRHSFEMTKLGGVILTAFVASSTIFSG